MAETAVRTEIREGIAVVRMDDGKANALSNPVIQALNQSLDRAEKEAGAVLLVGRGGRFCAGFDLGTMRSGPAEARTLVTAGAELCLRMFELPVPVVSACTGHALAAGALLLLSSDLRVGARGSFKVGLSEVAIGLTLPLFAVELARARLSKRHFARAAPQAEIYTPEEAVDAGYLDRVVEPEKLEETAFAEAARLAQLPQPAFRHTKLRCHGDIVNGIRATLEEDMKSFMGVGG